MSFTSLIRKQFEFHTDASTLKSILQEIANLRINIIGYIINQRKSRVDVTLVVGLVGNLQRDKEWNSIVRKILKSNDVQYCTRKVVDTVGTMPGIPGTLSRIYSALVDEVQIYTIYRGQGDRIFIDSNNPAKAIKILSSL